MNRARTLASVTLAALVGLTACQTPGGAEGEEGSSDGLAVHDTATGHGDPGGAYYKGTLYVGYAGTDGGLNIMRRTGGTWSKQVLPEKILASSGASLAVYHDQLYVAWIERADTHGLSIMRTTDGVTWRDKRTVGTSLGFTPALVIYGDRLNAFVGVYHWDNQGTPIHQFVFNDNGLEAEARAPYVITGGAGLTAAVLGNDLFLGFQGLARTMVLGRFIPGRGWQTGLDTKLNVEGTLFSEGGSSLLLIGRGDASRNAQILFHRTRDGQTFLPLGVANAWTFGRPVGLGNPRVGTIEFAFTGTDGLKTLNVETFDLDPQTSLDAPTNVDIDWVMPKRTYGPRCDRDMLPDSRFVAPSTWPLTLNACMAKAGTTAIDRYEWTLRLKNGSVKTQTTKECSWATDVNELGEHTASVTLVTKIGSSATANRIIHVRDYLIVSIGDSYASGEGNPQANCRFRQEGCLAYWNEFEDPKEICRRTWTTGPARAAIAAEDADPHSSVTFISSACTGHTTVDAQAPGNQIDRIRQAIGNRTIDAVVLSMGGNDIGFGDIITRCARPIVDCMADVNLDFLVKVSGDMIGLPNKYDALAVALRQRLAPKQVFITEYPDITRDSSGSNYCHVIMKDAAGAIDGNINPAEMDWAYNNVILKLNRAVHTSAARNGWQVIGGIQDGFRPHGYCAQDPWVRRFEDSWRMQGNEKGSFHPNERGHAFIGQRIWDSALKQVTKDPLNHRVLYRTPDQFTNRMCPLPCKTHCSQNLDRCSTGCGVGPNGEAACRQECQAVFDACQAACN